MHRKPSEPTVPQLTTKKRTIFIGIMIFIFAVLLETFSALFLFRYYSATENAFFPTGPASVYLVQKALKIWPFHTAESVDSPPLYVDDDQLAYTTRPGNHRVALSVGSKTHRFSVTVPQRGLRATGYHQENRPMTIYTFGDSYIFGWGNSDEHTMPWLLQQKFPQYRVLNLAQNGYGITHAVIQFEKLKDSIKEKDIIILPYADFYLVRNYGAPSLLRANAYRGDRRWPVVRSKVGGEWTIDYINMDCSKNGQYCDQADPEPAVMIEATKKIIAFFSKVSVKVVLVHLSGPDNDPVIAYARQLGMPLIDIRLDGKSPEWDNFLPFDFHPGPIAQYNYFRKLSQGLIERNIIEGTRD